MLNHIRTPPSLGLLRERGASWEDRGTRGRSTVSFVLFFKINTPPRHRNVTSLVHIVSTMRGLCARGKQAFLAADLTGVLKCFRDCNFFLSSYEARSGTEKREIPDSRCKVHLVKVGYCRTDLNKCRQLASQDP